MLHLMFRFGWKTDFDDARVAMIVETMDDLFTIPVFKLFDIKDKEKWCNSPNIIIRQHIPRCILASHTG